MTEEEIAARTKVRENHIKIKQVPCPVCGAPRFAACKSPKGSQHAFPHQARRHAAAEAGVYQP